MEVRTKIQRKHKLIESNFEDCIMLYDIEEGKYYVLNSLGSIIWGHLNEEIGTDIWEIIDTVRELYPGVDSIEEDVSKFIENMVERGIVLRNGP